VRCLKVLLARGIDVPLVVTHADDPGEAQWFGSVAATAADYGIPAIAPPDPNAADVVARVAALAPDFLFSFYYRRLLGASLLAIPPQGALNMHGSLLPKFRGRAPVNWALLAGERETGATLHYMTMKPDDGDIVRRPRADPSRRHRARGLRQGYRCCGNDALRRAAHAVGGYRAARAAEYGKRQLLGGRRRKMESLTGAMTPPRSTISCAQWRRRIRGPYRHQWRCRAHPAHPRCRWRATRSDTPVLEVDRERLVARCGGGGDLEVLALEIDGAVVAPEALAARFGSAPLRLGAGSVG
jgi:methionyl-tRNA formyltransferase